MSDGPIVLVEDDDDHAELTLVALRRAGIGAEVVRARDGRTALELLLTTSAGRLPTRPGLVLLDLRLPDLDGRTVLARLRADREAASLPIVLLTASHPGDIPQTAGADGCLKPPRPETLAALARRAGLLPGGPPATEPGA